MNFYGKDNLISRLDSLAKENRLPHAIILHGEKGVGKRETARYIAKQLLCGTHPPCESCDNCRRISNDTHPDVIFPRRAEDKYTMDTMRHVISDSAVKPNDGNIKVYVFERFDEMNVQQQNTLLKLIEEPLPYLRFIFTAENISSVLVTILSRAAAFSVERCSVADCVKALTEKGIDVHKAEQLAASFSGNIGLCLAGIENETEQQCIENASAIAEAISMKNEYALAAAFSKLTNRDLFWQTLGFLNAILRDAMVFSGGSSSAESSNSAAAKSIAEKISIKGITGMMTALFELQTHKDYNINVQLMTTDIAVELYDALSK